MIINMTMVENNSMVKYKLRFLKFDEWGVYDDSHSDDDTNEDEKTFCGRRSISQQFLVFLFTNFVVDGFFK